MQIVKIDATVDKGIEEEKSERRPDTPCVMDHESQ